MSEDIKNNEEPGISGIQGNSEIDTPDSDGSSFEDLAEDIHKQHVEEVEEEQEEKWIDVLGSGHILKKITTKGVSDIRPLRYNICKINLEGRLKSTKEIIEKEENFEIQSGCGDVIQAIDLVIPLMYEGETCELQITPRFGYGSVGNPPKIPADADLEYTITLLSFEDEPDLDTLSIEQRQAIGIKKRERGNWWYRMQDPSLAIQCYKKAIEYLDESEGGITDPTHDGQLAGTSKALYDLLSERMKAYNNMAAAQIKVESYDAALVSVDHVLKCQPDNVKALFRKGKILAIKNDPKEAAKVLKEALRLSPDDIAIKKELVQVEEKNVVDERRERELARKMFSSTVSSKESKDKDKENKPKKDKKKLFFWGTLLFSIAMGALSIAIYKYKFA